MRQRGQIQRQASVVALQAGKQRAFGFHQHAPFAQRAAAVAFDAPFDLALAVAVAPLHRLPGQPLHPVAANLRQRWRRVGALAQRLPARGQVVLQRRQRGVRVGAGQQIVQQALPRGVQHRLRRGKAVQQVVRVHAKQRVGDIHRKTRHAGAPDTGRPTEQWVRLAARPGQRSIQRPPARCAALAGFDQADVHALKP